MNLRVIKKDIDFLTDEFLSDALISLGFASGDDAKREKITEVINEAIDLRCETYSKVNHPDKENVKAFYRATTEGFLTSLDAIYDKLSKVVNEKKEAAPAAKKPSAKKAPAKKAAPKKEETAE